MEGGQPFAGFFTLCVQRFRPFLDGLMPSPHKFYGHHGPHLWRNLAKKPFHWHSDVPRPRRSEVGRLIVEQQAETGTHTSALADAGSCSALA